MRYVGLHDLSEDLRILRNWFVSPSGEEVLQLHLLGSVSLRRDERDQCTHEVDALMQKDWPLDALECRPLGELPIGDAELEFVGRDAQGERYAEELFPSWAGAKTAASSDSSASVTPQSLRATS